MRRHDRKKISECQDIGQETMQNKTKKRKNQVYKN